MRRVIVAALLISWAAPVLASNHPAHVAALSPQANAAAAVVDAFHAALRRGDTAGAATLLASDGLIFEGGHAERSKAEYAAHHLGADAEFAGAVPSKVIRRIGTAAGNMA
jgi:hypothetical protein